MARYSTNVGEIISELDTRLGAGQNTGTYEIVPEAGGDFDEEVPIEITLVD